MQRFWSGRPGLRIFRSAAAGLLGLFLLLSTLVPATAQVPKEHDLKAVFLWRLAQFVTWPSNAFENAESPLVIGVLGSNPFGEALESVVVGETANGRKLAVEYYPRLSQVKKCHVLFISKTETRRIKEILANLAKRNVLTVSDIDDLELFQEGMVRILMEQNKIKLRINPDAAAEAGLVLDARLLRMSEIVRKR